MITFSFIILSLSFYFILHTYVVYPFLLKFLSKGKNYKHLLYNLQDELPTVSIVLAAFNEEVVIAEKIESIYKSNYPASKLNVYVGSDNSTDRTHDIINKLQQKHPSLHLKIYNSRTGKASIVNELVVEAKGEILILTDANVFFSENMIFELVKHFKESKIGIVGGNILNHNIKSDGISLQEKAYLKSENLMKYQEGLLWGSMIGAFGGCYAIRKNCYPIVPPENYIVDDFYITMKVIEGGKLAINELNAVCYEDVSNVIFEEFRRKIRISTGNFQNLKTFAHLLWPPSNAVSFCFFSHKVLRWITPFLIIAAFLSSAMMASKHISLFYLFIVQCVMFLIPFIDLILRKISLHLVFLRFITHFYTMNLALLIGFYKYMKGVNSNVWQPTRRNQ